MMTGIGHVAKPTSRKTVVRAIRITEELDRVLRDGANSKSINVSSLMQSIFTRHDEQDGRTEKSASKHKY
jgi:hypothetical protein